MKYTERWAKARKKMAQGGQVTPGDQSRQLSNEWRQQLAQATNANISQAQLAPSLSPPQAQTGKVQVQSVPAQQGMVGQLTPEQRLQFEARVREMARQQPTAQPTRQQPMQAQTDAAASIKNMQQRAQQLTQQFKSSDMVMYKPPGESTAGLMAVGTKAQRDRNIDAYNRQQKIEKIARQRAARNKNNT